MAFNAKNLPISSQKSILNYRHINSEIIQIYSLNPSQQLLVDTYLEKVNSLMGEGSAFNTYRQKLLNEFRFVNQNHQQIKSFLYTFFKNDPQVISVFESKKIFPFMIDLIRDRAGKYHLVLGSIVGYDLRSLPRDMIFHYYVEYESAITQRYFNPDALMALKNLLDDYYDQDKRPAIFIQLDRPDQKQIPG